MKQRILIIDDDRDFTFAVKVILENAGYDCDTVHSIKEGVAFLKNGQPALILLDIMLEDIASGFRFAKWLRDREAQHDKSSIPIIMISSIQRMIGYDFKERLHTPLLPVDGFLTKPVDPKKLLNEIKLIIEHC